MRPSCTWTGEVCTPVGTTAGASSKQKKTRQALVTLNGSLKLAFLSYGTNYTRLIKMSERTFMTVAVVAMAAVCVACGAALILEVLLHDAGC